MAGSEKLFSTLGRYFVGTLLTVLAILPHARAEIILDDFDDPFTVGEIVMPEMNRQYTIETDIGPLAAERWSQVNASSASQPTGRADINISRLSALSVEIGEVNPHPTGPPAIGINVLYDFDEIDLTQGGKNDRVVVDFANFRSAIPLAGVDVFIGDAQSNYVSRLFDISTQDGPFSLEFPFDSFGVRGGGAGNLNPTRAQGLSFTISPTFFTDIDLIDFSIVVERIRITHAIPEPRTVVLVYFAVCAAVLFLVRERSVSHAGQDHFTGVGLVGASHRHGRSGSAKTGLVFNGGISHVDSSRS